MTGNGRSRMNGQFVDRVFYGDSCRMAEVPDNAVHCIVTSPPYFSIKDYSLDGHQKTSHSKRSGSQIGDVAHFGLYLDRLLSVWLECQRVLAPNGKLAINAPLMPMPKRDHDTHFNRHIFDLNAEIQHTILKGTALYLLDTYIWNRTNPTKGLMFGSYPYPRNLYSQNTAEFVTVYVKDGKSTGGIPKDRKGRSRLSQKEWTEYTRQVWDIPIPGRGDSAFGLHPAIMPEEIPDRCIRMFTFEGDTVLDPFAGSGTTLKVAKRLGRHYVGYEIMEAYRPCIERKLSEAAWRQQDIGAFTDPSRNGERATQAVSP